MCLTVFVSFTVNMKIDSLVKAKLCSQVLNIFKNGDSTGVVCMCVHMYIGFTIHAFTAPSLSCSRNVHQYDYDMS